MTNKAEKLYLDFHKYEAKKIGEFPSSFGIPQDACLIGDALYILYKSSKCDPLTYIRPGNPINYIHEHKAGVKVYTADHHEEGVERVVPQYIHSVEALTLLGKCLGFGYTDFDGNNVDANCTSCELYSIPSGKALLIIEKKKEVLALIWGGQLNVEPRGIVG